MRRRSRPAPQAIPRARSWNIWLSVMPWLSRATCGGVGRVRHTGPSSQRCPAEPTGFVVTGCNIVTRQPSICCLPASILLGSKAWTRTILSVRICGYGPEFCEPLASVARFQHVRFPQLAHEGGWSLLFQWLVAEGTSGTRIISVRN